jgi:hypothetical protein
MTLRSGASARNRKESRCPIRIAPFTAPKRLGNTLGVLLKT